MPTHGHVTYAYAFYVIFVMRVAHAKSVPTLNHRRYRDAIRITLVK